MAYQIWIQIVEVDRDGDEVGSVGDPELVGEFESRPQAGVAIKAIRSGLGIHRRN